MLIQYQWNDSQLKKIWKDLYKNNPYLYPFSSWEYNEQVNSYKRIKPQTLFQKEYFFVYYHNNIPLMIMPLFKKRGTFYIFGENISGPDNLDFIYDKNIKNEDIYTAIKELKEKFPNTKLNLYKINERSKVYSFFKDNEDDLKNYDIHIELDRVCVKICFPDEYQAYFQGLSRNARSNLHKAYNKIKKNNINIHLEVVRGPFSNKKLLSALMKIYTKRESERKDRSLDFFPFLKHRYASSLTWAMQTMKEHYTFCLYINENPAAFMSGFVTNFNEIVFPIVAMNSSFREYVPGKLMINESIKYLQKKESIRVLDLSRGDERYKFEMGGSKHYNYRIFLSF